MTLVLLAALGAVFLKGFREAVGMAVPIVVIYLALNAVLIVAGLHHLLRHPELFSPGDGCRSRVRQPGR